MAKVILILSIMICITGYSQISYLNLTGLTNSNNITARPIGTTGVTFDANITTVGSPSNPEVTNNGSIAIKLNGGATQCINLTFSENVQVYISDNISHNGVTFNKNDRVLFDNPSYIETDPSNRVKMSNSGGTAILVPRNNIRYYTTWNLTFGGSTTLQICGKRNKAIPTNNNALTIRIGIVIATLPIKLLDFNAILIDKSSVQLNWQTSSETNNDYFSIERSKNGQDWEEINTIKGAGNSSSILNYSVNDFNAFKGVSYYRLKQTDFDGKYTYSQIKSVNVKSFKNIQLEVFPNPTENRITIIGDKTELKQVRIFNILGQDVTSLTSVISNENNSKIIIDLESLTNGLYLIKGKTAVVKLYKNK